MRAEQYGSFLCSIFDEWVRQDIGRVFVQLFDVALQNWMGSGPSLCVFAEKCGAALAVEHNGDLYSCDHYVYPSITWGNIMNSSLMQMVASRSNTASAKRSDHSAEVTAKNAKSGLPATGECPKHRFTRTPDGNPGLNYLCPRTSGSLTTSTLICGPCRNSCATSGRRPS